MARHNLVGYNKVEYHAVVGLVFIAGVEAVAVAVDNLLKNGHGFGILLESHVNVGQCNAPYVFRHVEGLVGRIEVTFGFLVLESV